MRVRGGGFLKEIRETARFAAGKFGVDKTVMQELRFRENRTYSSVHGCSYAMKLLQLKLS